MKFPGSTLEAMFSGRHSLTKHKGRIYIDRDGLPFSQMISYLRSGMKPPFADSADTNQQLVHFRGKIISQEERMFYRELTFWQIPTPE